MKEISILPFSHLPRRARAAFAALLVIVPMTACAAIDGADYRAHPEFPAFVARLEQQHAYTPAELDVMFAGVGRQQAILDAISRPAESKDWHEYRPIFITEARIRGGVEFWDEHADTLTRAEREYGVDQDVIVAVIGVETFYGRITGSWRVIDALATLAFDYPPRSPFFTSELEQFLLLTREEAVDPRTVTGSYAGAMGGGQFMPSSYRQYAVDFDADGRRDLWASWADVIGSVAHYLARFGWRHGDVVALPAAVPENVVPPLVTQGIERFPATALRERGVVFSEGVPEDAEVRLIALQDEKEMHYWIGLHNFGVINRYNRSALYGMAVVDLASAIVDHRANRREKQ